MRGGNARSCEVGTFAMDSMVNVLGKGIVNDADEGFELVGEG